ncbi:hypothetical protein F8M41_024533 [Gigaspora margarita]|uniref:Uncharacterized protein n=1 Tax=Gigaspora margarita TaxID=4874 RepID=A0A8H3XKX3_GIGMA|nr:hypothetical protein F8M41_024533 [Gigaspora margarita]
MTQAQQIIDGSLVANAEFQERILNDDEDIFIEDADAFREAMVQKAHEQNQDLINLMENETIGLYHSHLLEPEKREPPRKRARLADSRQRKIMHQSLIFQLISKIALYFYTLFVIKIIGHSN